MTGPVECPTPWKTKFYDQQGAERHQERVRAMHATRRRAGKPGMSKPVATRPYPCPCGWWHVATVKRGKRKRGGSS